MSRISFFKYGTIEFHLRFYIQFNLFEQTPKKKVLSEIGIGTIFCCCCCYCLVVFSVAASLGTGYDFYHPPRRNKSMITPVHRFQTVDCRNVSRPNVHRPNVHRSNHHHQGKQTTYKHTLTHNSNGAPPFSNGCELCDLILNLRVRIGFSFPFSFGIQKNIISITHLVHIMKFKHTLRWTHRTENLLIIPLFSNSKWLIIAQTKNTHSVYKWAFDDLFIFVF